MKSITFPSTVFAVAAAARKPKRRGAAGVGAEGPYNLSAILVERDESGIAWAVAADGKCLLAASWSDPGEPLSCLVEADHWKEMARLAKASNVRLAVSNDRLLITAEGKDGKRSLDLPAASGMYPAWRCILSANTTTAPVERLYLQGRLLALVVRSIEKITGSSVLAVSFPAEVKRPLLLKASVAGLDVHGILFRVNKPA